ncbi:hypothetical protein [Asaia bogorensis]|uniref:hypothetical protein n=1 Tax=Asaia bogorensis TaxID=91915 RepID=UPI0030186207
MLFLAWHKPPGPVPLPFQDADLGFEGGDFLVLGGHQGQRAGWLRLGLPVQSALLSKSDFRPV